MKNAKRSLSFILCITQIIICAAVMIIIAHDLSAETPWFDLNLSEQSLVVLLVVFNLSLLVTVISLIFVIKWDSPNGLVGWGIASIFMLNLGAGIAMTLGAHQLSYRIDAKRKLAIVFALGQIFLAIIFALLVYVLYGRKNGFEAINAAQRSIVLAAVSLSLLSIGITVPSLILSISCRNPKGLLVMGVLSIFLLNLGCGIMMVLKAPEVKAFLDAKAR